MVCLREPVSQNLSWWRYERGAMTWAESMGLPRCARETAPAFRHCYPPASLEDAFHLSQTAEVTRLFQQAEQLPLSAWRLPSALACVPNGQLSIMAQLGCFADSLGRYLALFPRQQLHTVELDDLCENQKATLDALCAFLGVPMLAAMPAKAKERLLTRHRNSASALRPTDEPTEDSLARMASFYQPHNERLFNLLGRRLPSFTYSPTKKKSSQE